MIEIRIAVAVGVQELGPACASETVRQTAIVADEAGDTAIREVGNDVKTPTAVILQEVARYPAAAG